MDDNLLIGASHDPVNGMVSGCQVVPSCRGTPIPSAMTVDFPQTAHHMVPTLLVLMSKPTARGEYDD